MKYRKITVCAVIFCREIENLIKLLISPGTTFGKEDIQLIYTESGDNIIIVVTWEISKSYVAEKKYLDKWSHTWNPRQSANVLYCPGNSWTIGRYAY